VSLKEVPCRLCKRGLIQVSLLTLLLSSRAAAENTFIIVLFFFPHAVCTPLLTVVYGHRFSVYHQLVELSTADLEQDWSIFCIAVNKSTNDIQWCALLTHWKIFIIIFMTIPKLV
jgi:hypothetical protein